MKSFFVEIKFAKMNIIQKELVLHLASHNEIAAKLKNGCGKKIIFQKYGKRIHIKVSNFMASSHSCSSALRFDQIRLHAQNQKL